MDMLFNISMYKENMIILVVIGKQVKKLQINPEKVFSFPKENRTHGVCVSTAVLR